MTRLTTTPADLRRRRAHYDTAGEELAQREADLNHTLSERAQALVDGTSVADIDKRRKMLQQRNEDLRMLRSGLAPLLPAEEHVALEVDLQHRSLRAKRTSPMSSHRRKKASALIRRHSTRKQKSSTVYLIQGRKSGLFGLSSGHG